MRKNTRIILSLLYALPDCGRRKIPITYLRELLPELSDGGFRSLLHHLQARHQCSVMVEHSAKVVIGTHTGDRSLEADFPWLRRVALSEQQAVGELLVFQQHPAHDPQFRRLRRLLIEDDAFPLGRGVYFKAKELSPGVWSELSQRYQTNVIVAAVQESRLGFLHPAPTQLLDSLQVLSGISSEIDRVIKQKKTWSELTDQQKNRFLSLFTQIHDIFGNYSGLLLGQSEQREVALAVLRTSQELLSLK